MKHSIWMDTVIAELRTLANYELRDGDQDYLDSFYNQGDNAERAAGDLLWVHGFRPTMAAHGKWSVRDADMSKFFRG